MDFEALYLTHRPFVEETAAAICRRSHASSADAEDFASALHVYFIDNDYAVLRAFQGRSELAAFLQTVIRRFFQDWRNAHWGRWRPSAGVRRLGPVAIQLETLLVRDGLALHEAIEVLRTNHDVPESSAQLAALAERFPPRARRVFVSDELLDEHAHEYANAAAGIEAADTAAEGARISRVLDRVLMGLPAEDQTILRMRFDDDVSVLAISRALRLDATQLYRRLDKLLRVIRVALVRSGISADDARGAMAMQAFGERDETPPFADPRTT